METRVDTSPVVREVTIDARPETIFPFLVDPEKVVRWKGTLASLDPRPGGLYSVDVTATAHARGEYVEVVPNERVVFTFGWDGSPIGPGSTTVEIDLIPQGSSTLVRLTHRGLPEDAKKDHTEGWTHYLGRLAIAATGGDPGRDPNLDAAPTEGGS